MPRSDRVWATGARRSDFIAVGLGALVAAIVLSVAIALEAFRYGPAMERLAADSRDVAGAIGRAIANDVERAVGLGIPLDKMVGVVPYLNSIRTANPSISAIAVVDGDDRVLFASPETSESDGGSVGVVTPVLLDETAIGGVVVAPSSAVTDRVTSHLRALGAAFALLAALVLGVTVRLWRLERFDLPEARFVAGGRAVAHGVFADFSIPRPGPFTPLGQAAARLTGPVRRAHRRLLALSDEVSALDVGGHYRSRVAGVHASLSHLVFDRPFRRHLRERTLLWWPLLALMAVAATKPLVASFAADRVSPDLSTPLFVGAAVAAGYIGAIVGLGLAVLLRGRTAKALATIALLAAAVAIGTVFSVRNVYTFIYLQAGIGAALWLAVWSTAAGPGLARRRPWQAALVLLAALAIGPTLGAILAEGTGRRTAFLIIGSVTGIVALLGLASSPRAPRHPRPRSNLSAGEWAALVAISLALVAWAEIHLPVETLREDYSGLALHAALIGTASLLPAALGLRTGHRLGAVLAAAALAASVLIPVPGAVVSIALGLGLGLSIHALGTRGFGTGAVLALLLGGLLAAGASALPVLAPETAAARLGTRELTALAAAVLAALALLPGRR